MANAMIQSRRLQGCSGTDSQNYCINVRFKGKDAEVPIKTESSEVLPFENKLLNQADAYVYFYDYKGGQLIPEFCGPNTNNPIKVEYGPGNKVDCQLFQNQTLYSMAFEYEVKASGHDDLDPVIIIKPADAALILDKPIDPGAIGVIGGIGGFVLGLIAAKLWAMWKPKT